MKPIKLVSPTFFKLPFMHNYAGICIGRFMIFKKEPDPIMYTHEMIHQEQMTTHGVIRFYIIYLLQYITSRLLGKSHYVAYRSISFEIEAYRDQVSRHFE